MLARQVTCMRARYWPTAALARRSTRPARLASWSGRVCVAPYGPWHAASSRRRRGRQCRQARAQPRLASRCAARPRPTLAGRGRPRGGAAAALAAGRRDCSLPPSRVATRAHRRARSGGRRPGPVPSRACSRHRRRETNVHAAVARDARAWRLVARGPERAGRGTRARLHWGDAPDGC
ncbi:hypothetical protein PVAP13_7NG287448 [Panicum virgatum]|uniref:Uncharacterized protein n=1 Tax=Panicum virgatum TaxID=38727 RepID=A0A8T0QCR9_PANVG|nr:hypothetical protein PVAP13_7NG287448 [Panicum virgatum]